MTSKGSNKHIFRWMLIVLLANALWGVVAFVYFYAYLRGFKKVKPIDTEGFAKCARNISNITIPDSVRIIALVRPRMAMWNSSNSNWMSSRRPAATGPAPQPFTTAWSS